MRRDVIGPTSHILMRMPVWWNGRVLLPNALFVVYEPIRSLVV